MGVPPHSSAAQRPKAVPHRGGGAVSSVRAGGGRPYGPARRSAREGAPERVRFRGLSPRGTIPGSIGHGHDPYGTLAKLLGRAPMLRVSRREDRKRVPQYSSLQLPCRAALGRTYGNLPGSVSAAPIRHPVGSSPTQTP